MQWISQLTELLANLSVKHVLIAVGAMMVLLGLFRLVSSRSREHGLDWLIENVQVVLSVVVVVFLIIRPFLFQAFYIPSSSMEPTLMGPPANGGQTTGDRLLVNKLIYRVTDPSRGDIVVFKAPRAASPDEKEFIKRVIGTPGDVVEVIGPRLMLGQRTALQLTGDTGPALSLGDRSEPKISKDGRTAEINPSYGQPIKVIAAPDPVVAYDPTRVTVNGEVVLEDPNAQILPDDLGKYGADPALKGSAYTISGDLRLIVLDGAKLSYSPGHVVVNGKPLVEPYIAEAPNYQMSAKKLGPHEYFMMGDNRNNSNDSHVWGVLTRDRVIGRAEILFWPVSRFNIMHWWLIAALAALFFGYQLVTKMLTGR